MRIRVSHVIAIFEAAKGLLALLAASGLELLGPAPLLRWLHELIARFQLDPNDGALAWLNRSINPDGVHLAAAVVLAYGLLRMLEAWGLWRAKAWASWLGCISAADLPAAGPLRPVPPPGLALGGGPGCQLDRRRSAGTRPAQAPPIRPAGGSHIAYAPVRPSATGESQCAHAYMLVVATTGRPVAGLPACRRAASVAAVRRRSPARRPSLAPCQRQRRLRVRRSRHRRTAGAHGARRTRAATR